METETGGPPAVSSVIARLVHAYSVRMTCPHCRQTVMTRVAYVPGVLTWIVSGVMGFCGCCCIYTAPFFVDSLKDAEHYCPNCNALLGVFRRM